MFDAPIALIIFNRPDSVRRSFARIRQARPSKLFIISDAPREQREGEAALVQQSREIAEQVDWQCDVRKIYASTNLGCKRRISSGISEALDEVDRLIIIEDDCVADPSFFTYASTLLDRYADDHRVMSVGGNNFQQGINRTRHSYYFSKYSHCWGWATWRRAWQTFDLKMSAWPQFRDAGHLASYCRNQRESDYWSAIFDRCYAGEIDSWAYPWLLTCWMHHGLATIPRENLVRNIGFGADATHTKDLESQYAQLAEGSLGELTHPASIYRHAVADAFTDDTLFSRQRRSRIKRLVSVLPRLSRAA